MIFHHKSEIVKYTFLLFLLTLNNISSAEPTLNLEQLECDVSIKAIDPASGSEINIGEFINVEINYSFKNVPSGVEIVVFPGIISSEADFQNFLPVAGIPLFGDDTLLHDVSAPSKPILKGKLHSTYLNQGSNIGSYESIIATLRFSRLANDEDLLKTFNSDIKSGITLLPIQSKDINCKTDITSSVNWVFTDKSN